MIDHISIAVSNLERAVPFYERSFAPLGMTRLVTRPAMVGFGKTYPEVWINLRAGMAPLPLDSGVHLCLRAKTTDEVDAFYAAAIAAGGVSESAPSLRPHDRVRYYATFIADADGNRIEVVTFPKDDATKS
ncbi:catechol 2,3-dioxygenase-like lactoylglutathione lyase family enzyme [Tardiphaga robiniae]|uniref:VOC family protein n=1 Tax=Tardiphaga robiniae TaxID=943830 RepID=UPI0028553F0E|nr:VOC family protein [Tardiphaga robiniae]MDR6659914.1 catechol 2,3-dioxygenase-like lactoylglutathione lyase family enzyme [Tardiphaga robiniae]